MIEEKPESYACIVLRLSNFYFFLTITQFVLACFIMVAIYFEHDLLTEFAELVSVFLITADLTIRYCSQKAVFLRTKQNWLDFIILVLLLGIIISRKFETQEYFHKDSVIGALGLIIRYILQLIRLIRLLKTARSIQQLNQSKIIDLKQNYILASCDENI